MHTYSVTADYFNDVANSKPYFILPTEAHKLLTKRLGHFLSSILIRFHELTMFGQQELSLSYLQDELSLSRKSIIACVRKLEQLKFLKVIRQHDKVGGSLPSRYEVTIPADVIQSIESSYNRTVNKHIDPGLTEHNATKVTTTLQVKSDTKPGEIGNSLVSEEADIKQVESQEEGGGILGLPHNIKFNYIYNNNPQFQVCQSDPAALVVCVNTEGRESERKPGYKGKNLDYIAKNCHKLVPEPVQAKIYRVIKRWGGSANPIELAAQALFAVACDYTGRGYWHGVGVFARLLTQGKWTTPYYLRGQVITDAKTSHPADCRCGHCYEQRKIKPFDACGSKIPDPKVQKEFIFVQALHDLGVRSIEEMRQIVQAKKSPGLTRG